MKTISKFILIILFSIILLIAYLSIFGFETTKFNNKIINKIEKIDKDLKIELKKIKIVLNPLELKLSVKTVGPKLKHKNKHKYARGDRGWWWRRHLRCQGLHQVGHISSRHA